MKFSFVILFPFLAALTVFSQNDSIRIETNLVTLNVAVTDAQGRAVSGLSKGDFSVFDNGVRQAVDAFSADNAPVSYGIIYDLHPTTGEQTESVLAALRKFTGSIGRSDDFFVSVFNEKGSLTTDFVPTEEQLRRQIDAGVNSLYDAIFAASTRMASARNHKRVLLVLTDGKDHNSLHSFKELRLHLRNLNLPVYSITFGGNDLRQYGYSDIFRDGQRQRLPVGETNELDRAMLGDISKTTGGQAFEGNARNRAYLAALCAKVGDEVKGQYVLGFYPENPDGKWHKLKIVVANPLNKKLKVSTRKGYQNSESRKSGK